MLDKMKQMMEMKKQADRIKRELDAITVDVTEVPGIKIQITGAQEFRTLEIDESKLTAGNKNHLQAELLRSVNAAIRKAQQAAAQKMAATMQLPGM